MNEERIVRANCTQKATPMARTTIPMACTALRASPSVALTIPSTIIASSRAG